MIAQLPGNLSKPMKMPQNKMFKKPNNGYACAAFYNFCKLVAIFPGRRGGLMVSALDSRASAPGSSPGRGHCVVFLGKTLYSHGAYLHPGV